MVQHLWIVIACLLVASCMGASSHISNNVPTKICSSSGGWTVFPMKNKQFNPPTSNALAQYTILSQMKDLVPQLLKELAAKGGYGPDDTAKWVGKFGEYDSWALDGCKKGSDQKYTVVFYIKIDDDYGTGYGNFYYQANIYSKVDAKGKYKITSWKFKDITNYD